MILPSYSCLLHDPRPLHLASSGPQPSLWLFWSLTEAQVLCLNLRVFNKCSAVVRKGFLKEEKNGERETEQGTRQDSVKQLSSTELTLHPHHSWRALLPLHRHKHLVIFRFEARGCLQSSRHTSRHGSAWVWNIHHQSSPPGAWAAYKGHKELSRIVPYYNLHRSIKPCSKSFLGNSEYL